MNSRYTWSWLLLAAALFAFIFFFERHWGKAPPGPKPLLPGFRSDAVTGITIRPADQFKISVQRTNGNWWITQPLLYPAQASQVEGLLAFLEKLVPATTLARSELKNPTSAEAEFGLENPQIALELQRASGLTTLKFGQRTAPGSEVFAQIVGREEIYVLDAEILKLLPARPEAWRDHALINLIGLSFDRLQLTNAGRVIRLYLTNQTWRLSQPLEARADGAYLQSLLQLLQNTRITGFVPEERRGDLEGFGLAAPELTLGLARGETAVAWLQFGHTNAAGQCFARRDGFDSIVTVPAAALAAWRQDFFAFRDRRLVALPAELAALEWRGPEGFSLERLGSNEWRVAGERFPVDAGRAQELLQQLANLEIVKFEKDVVLPPELGAYGLTSAVRQVVFKGPPSGLSNASPLQLDFGATNGEAIYVHRSDENSIYAVRLADFLGLPSSGWQLREQRVWSFSLEEVARVTARQGGWVREAVHSSPRGWALAAGSQGVLDNECMDEAMRHLGQLRATPWVARGKVDDARFGFSTNSLSLGVELRSGARLELQFGGNSPAGYPYARVSLEGEPWVFEFSRAVHVLLLSCLAVPPGA